MHYLGGFLFGMVIMMVVSHYDTNISVLASVFVWFSGWLFFTAITTCYHTIQICRHIVDESKESNG